MGCLTLRCSTGHSISTSIPGTGRSRGCALSLAKQRLCASPRATAPYRALRVWRLHSRAHHSFTYSLPSSAVEPGPLFERAPVAAHTPYRCRMYTASTWHRAHLFYSIYPWALFSHASNAIHFSRLPPGADGLPCPPSPFHLSDLLRCPLTSSILHHLFSRTSSPHLEVSIVPSASTSIRSWMAPALRTTQCRCCLLLALSRA